MTINRTFPWSSKRKNQLCATRKQFPLFSCVSFRLDSRETFEKGLRWLSSIFYVFGLIFFNEQIALTENKKFWIIPPQLSEQKTQNTTNFPSPSLNLSKLLSHRFILFRSFPVLLSRALSFSRSLRKMPHFSTAKSYDFRPAAQFFTWTRVGRQHGNRPRTAGLPQLLSSSPYGGGPRLCVQQKEKKNLCLRKSGFKL